MSQFSNQFLSFWAEKCASHNSLWQEAQAILVALIHDRLKIRCFSPLFASSARNLNTHGHCLNASDRP